MGTRIFSCWLIQAAISWMLCSGFYVQPELPSFFDSPGSLAVLEDTPLVLSCTILSREVLGDLPRPSIHWLHNGTAIMEDPGGGGVTISTTSNTTAITSQLHVRSPMPQHAGYYQCLARDGMDDSLCGSSVPHQCISVDVLSDTGWIYIVPRDSDHSHNVVEVQIAESALLVCGSDYLHSRPVTWLKDKTSLTNSSTEFLLLNGDLMVYGEDNGTVATYECLVSAEMEMEMETVLYRSYEVIVTDTGNYLESDVTIFATSTIVLPDQTIQLACSVALSNSLDAAQVSWTRGDLSSIEKGVVSLSRRVLSVGGATVDDAADYCCFLGDSRSCVYVAVATPEASSLSSSPVSSIFIKYKQSTTHSVDISCSIPDSIPLVNWFRNGVKLDNETGHRLIRTNNDPYQLYGVYQCSVAWLFQHVSNRRVLTVARVLPHGVTNPVKGLQYLQYLYPVSVNVNMLVFWAAPDYRGNLSSLQYVVTLNERTSHLVRSETKKDLTVQKHSYNRVDVTVLDGEYAAASTTRRIYIMQTSSSCDFHTYYPPKINAMSCSSGAVELRYEFDTVANAEFDFLRDFNEPKLYYFFGGCRDEDNHLIYSVNYASGNGSSYFFQGGVVFKAGTWCIIRVGNTPMVAPSICLNERYIMYSNDSDCFVHATVGFESTEYVVDESTGHVQVCVRSKGYGFNLTISSSNPEVARLDSVELSFDSVMVTRRCVDVAIADDNVLRSNNMTLVQLTVATNNYYVVMETNTTHLIILENDSVLVEFDSDSYFVQDDEYNFTACVNLLGKLGKNISVTMTTQNGSAKVSVDFPPFSKTVFFEAHSFTNRRCVSVPIYPRVLNEVGAPPKTFFLLLSTSSLGVLVRDVSSNVTIAGKIRGTPALGTSAPGTPAPGTSLVIWISVGVAISIVMLAVLIMAGLLVGSHLCLERLKMKERVMDANFRRRPLMEPYDGQPPSSWPDPVALNAIFPIAQDCDKYSDICNLDNYEAEYPTVITTFADGNGGASESSTTVTPMVSASTIGGASVMTSSSTDWRSSGHKWSDTSCSTLGEYINPFVTEDKPKIATELLGEGLNFPRKLSEDASAIDLVFREDKEVDSEDSKMSSSSSKPSELLSVECEKIVLSDSRIGTKHVDQDSGFGMQDTSGVSFVQDHLPCNNAHSSSNLNNDLHSEGMEDFGIRGSCAATSTEFNSNDQGLDSGCQLETPSQFDNQESNSGSHFDSHSVELRPKDPSDDSGCHIGSISSSQNRLNQLQYATDPQ